MTTTHDPGTFDRFARAHLRNRVERAVYRTVAGQHEASTVAEIAAHAKVSHHEADQVLRHFAAAGIVTRVDSIGQHHRYQWSPTMTYLAEAGQLDGGSIDPICGMPVTASQYTATGPAGQLSFCSLGCLVRWKSLGR